MTSKERVLTAIAHQQPDRVPINYIANPGIDGRLKAYYGLRPDDNEGLYRVLGVDLRRVAAPYTGPALHAPVPDRVIDMWGIRRRWIEHESGGYWEYCDFPLRDATLEEIEAWPFPDSDHFDFAAAAEQCRQLGEYCIVAGGPGFVDIINHSGMVRTMEQVLVDLLTDDPACLRLIDRRLEVELAIAARTLEAAKGLVDLFYIGEDLGTQQGPLISLELFRKHFRPRHQRMIDLAKSYNLPVMIHSCGSSSWAFDDFIEMGIDVVDTLQPEARDMAPAYLKSRFGDRLAFHGCISTAGPVAYGAPDDVTANVRDTLEIMMPGGGYILSPTHQLQDNSPTENVAAMYEAGKEYGLY